MCIICFFQAKFNCKVRNGYSRNKTHTHAHTQCEVKDLQQQLSQQADYCTSMGAACCTLLWRVSRQEECIHSILSGVRISLCMDNFTAYRCSFDTHMHTHTHTNTHSRKSVSSSSWEPPLSRAIWTLTTTVYLRKEVLSLSLCWLYVELSPVMMAGGTG